MPELWILAVAALVILVGFVAKGAAGFGDSLLIIPLLALMLPVKFVLPVTLLVTACADLYLLYHHHRDIRRGRLAWLIPAALIGVVAGTALLRGLPAAELKIALAVFVLLAALRLLITAGDAGTRPERLPHAGWALVAGFAAGAIDAVFGVGGPPLIIYLTSAGLAPAPFRATFILLVFVLHSSRIVAYGLGGLFTIPMLLTAACLVPAMVVGAWLGRRLHARLNPVLFVRVAAALLIVIGIRLLF